MRLAREAWRLCDKEGECRAARRHFRAGAQAPAQGVFATKLSIVIPAKAESIGASSNRLLEQAPLDSRLRA
jgi:hypothetical protein